MKTELGCFYKDVISGASGISIGRVEYITGCNQVLLEPGIDAQGKKVDAFWVDEQRCELDASREKIVLDNGSTPGCALAAPII